MRALLFPCLILLSGCVVQSGELNRPQVLARIDSTHTAADFAACVGASLGRPVRNDDGVLYVIVPDNIGVQVTRWDFLATLSGSQAELRSGAEGGHGLAEVRSCATA